MVSSRFKQIKIYVDKHFRLFKNEKGWKSFIFAAIIACAVAVGVDGSFSDDIMTNGIAFVSACIWIGLFNTIQRICKERDIIKREHRTGLHISSYVISHLIFQAFMCFIETIIMCVASKFDFFGIFFLLIYGADVLGIAISSIVKTPDIAMTVMPFVLIFQLIFGGMIPGMGNGGIAKFTLSKWGIGGIYASTGYCDSELAYINAQINATEEEIGDAVKESVKNAVKDNLQNSVKDEAKEVVDNSIKDSIAEATKVNPSFALLDEQIDEIEENLIINANREIDNRFNDEFEEKIDNAIDSSLDEQLKDTLNPKVEERMSGEKAMLMDTKESVDRSNPKRSLFLHILCYAIISIIALKFVDRDKR